MTMINALPQLNGDLQSIYEAGWFRDLNMPVFDGKINGWQCVFRT